jgi:hypothetical protein
VVRRLRSEGGTLAEGAQGDCPSSNHFRPLNLCSGSCYRLAMGNPCQAASELGPRVWLACAGEEGCPEES